MRFLSDTIGDDRSVLGPCMQVIGAGLPRCATSSLQAALEAPALNFDPCMHMAHIAPNAARCQLIIDAMLETDTHKRHKILHKVFDGYKATTDYPGFWFIEDLMDMYPDAPVILNQRKGGGESWLKSFEGSIGFFNSWQYALSCFPMKTDRLHYTIHQITRRQWEERWGVDYGPKFYDAYQEFVIREAKKRGREVLVWKAEDGWEPICKFLGKDVPQGEPFPWVNDAATMTMLKRILIARGLLCWAAIFGSAYATWRFWPQLLGKVALVQSWLVSY